MGECPGFTLHRHQPPRLKSGTRNTFPTSTESVTGKKRHPGTAAAFRGITPSHKSCPPLPLEASVSFGRLPFRQPVIACNMTMRLRKQRRLASSCSDGRRRASNNRGTWFDKLPEEVCERLAAHVCHQEQNLDGLALAKTCRSLRKAVITVLGHRLTIYDKRFLSRRRYVPRGGNWDTVTTRKWISVMGEDLFEVVQPLLLTLERGRPPRFTLPLLFLPNLRMVQITDHPTHLAAVSCSSSIREVTIYFWGQVPSTEIFATFSKLRLERLKTFCPEPLKLGPDFRCPYQGHEVTGSEPNVISESLPHLKSIELYCGCSRTGAASFWGFLPSLKTLQEVSVRFVKSPDAIPEEAIRFLSTRDSVRLLETLHPHTLAAVVGRSISEISHGLYSLFHPFTEEQVRDLGNFPRLKALRFKIMEGADEALPEVVEKLPELRVLDVVWVRSVNEAQMPSKYEGAQFVTASPGTVMRAIRAAPQLSELCIGRVRIPLMELVSVLKFVGRRLRVFCASISHQEEASLERLEALLLTAAKCNTELRSFLLVDGWTPHLVLKRGLTPRDEWERQKERVLARVRFLGDRAPYMDAVKLRGTIERMVIER